MKRLLGLLLALALLTPLCLSNGSISGADTQEVAVAGETHCPVDTPDHHYCAPSADPVLNISHVSPRPDTNGLFGAQPAVVVGLAMAPRAQGPPAPDLYQLSVTRI
ncbi:hypothetical protein ACSYDW_10180 [Paeniglutamicibacter sp. R2-26]|uniref:hypothetical protein n=1 Tax=Paeniglutamicibacter sp. R2-26 TaxID=3144417 RepID=UPI003EE6C919